MLRLFKKKKYADFWIKYLEIVKSSSKFENYESIRFVVLDTETTGFNYENDRILSIGAIAIQNNKIIISDAFEVYLKQDVFNKETVKIHGIRKNGHEIKLTEEEALIEFIKYLGNGIIVAHHTKFDVTMLNKALRRIGGGTIRSIQLDTNFIHKKIAPIDYFNKSYTLDELCECYNITKHDRHNAMGDALLTALLFLKLTYKFRKNNILNLKDLIKTNYHI